MHWTGQAHLKVLIVSFKQYHATEEGSHGLGINSHAYNSETRRTRVPIVVPCPFKLNGRHHGECRRNLRDIGYKSTSAPARATKSGRKERRTAKRREPQTGQAEALPATYANAGKSIYLYLFIAFKCFLGTRLRLVPVMDHPEQRIDSARGP